MSFAKTVARTAARTPYCKICHDAGKPKSQYTSHFVKDSPGPDGKVVCPYLLSLECRYCHEGGHTVKHCPKLEAKNARVAGGERFRQQLSADRVWAPSTPVQPARTNKCKESLTRAPKKAAPRGGFSVLANLPAEQDPNADRPAEEGPRRILFKARGAWAAGAPVTLATAVAAAAATAAPLPAIEELDDSWMASATDEWGSGDLDMGAQATRVCPQ